MWTFLMLLGTVGSSPQCLSPAGVLHQTLLLLQMILAQVPSLPGTTCPVSETGLAVNLTVTWPSSLIVPSPCFQPMLGSSTVQVLADVCLMA